MASANVIVVRPPLAVRYGQVILVRTLRGPVAELDDLPLDPVARLLREHPFAGGDRRVIGRGQVGGDQLVEVGRFEVVERRAAVDAGHVHQGVDPAEPRDRLAHGPFGLARIGQVGLNGQALGAGGLDVGDGRLDRLAAV